MSGSTVTPATNAYDWAIRINDTTLTAAGVALTPRIPNGQPGQILRAQAADIVAWGNASSHTHQIASAVINSGTVTCQLGPNSINVTVAGTNTTCPIATITVTGGTMVASTNITGPIASQQSSAPQFVVPANAGGLVGIGTNCVLASAFTIPAGTPVNGAGGNVTLSATPTIFPAGPVGTIMATLNTLLVAIDAPLPYLCIDHPTAVAEQGIIFVVQAV